MRYPVAPISYGCIQRLSATDLFLLLLLKAPLFPEQNLALPGYTH